MRTIALVLSDNDFGNTFRPLLESIYRAIVYRGGNVSRSQVEEMVASGIAFHYVAYQRRGEADDPGEQSLASYVEYLSSVKVLFDEEAENDICQNFHDGGAWYLEVQSGNVSAY